MLFALSLSLSRANPFVNSPSISPNFSQPALTLPAGTKVQPLCSSPLDPLCLHDWSQMAEPMAIHPSVKGQPPSYRYFLPGFLPSKISSEDPRGSRNWDRINLSSSYSGYRGSRGRSSRYRRRGRDRVRDRRSGRGSGSGLGKGSDRGSTAPSPQEQGSPPAITYYQSKTDPNQVRIVKRDAKGDLTVKEISKERLLKGDEAKAVSQADLQDSPEDWNPYTPPPAVISRLSSEAEKEATQNAGGEQTSSGNTSVEREFFAHREDSDRVVAITTNREGTEEITEGQIAYVNEDALISVPVPDPTPAPDSAPTPDSAPAPDSVPVPDPTPAPAPAPDSAFDSAPEDDSSADGNSGNLAASETSSPAAADTYQTTQPTTALPAATGVKEIQEGCFLIEGKSLDKDKQAQTEASFCPDCRKESADSTVLSSLLGDEGILQKLQDWLSQVSTKGQKRIAGKIAGGGRIDSVEKICSPERSLSAIINNFKEKCLGSFKDFFERSYCKSCKKGIPPELMMAMMSIESAGKCPATNDNPNEHSVGLFQVDASQHYTCNDQTYRQSSPPQPSLVACLKNPVNNLAKGLEIFSDHYEKVNGENPPPPSSKCPVWTDLPPEERDRQRKALSAYNGGPGWVLRAIRSAHETKLLESGQSGMLSGTQRELPQEYVGDSTNWEDLRWIYFIEKLLPAEQGKAVDNTISNLAHVEAVLGRDVPGARPSLVDLWSQYTKNFIKRDSPQCR